MLTRGDLAILLRSYPSSDEDRLYGNEMSLLEASTPTSAEASAKELAATLTNGVGATTLGDNSAGNSVTARKAGHRKPRKVAVRCSLSRECE